MRDINRIPHHDIQETLGAFNFNKVVLNLAIQEWIHKQNKKFSSYLEYDFFTGKEPILRIHEDKT
jgi:hypothetical protein